MSTNNISWFHCGRCGSLFLSPAGEPEGRHCTSCGCNPSLGIAHPNTKIQTAPNTLLPTIQTTDLSGTRRKIHSRGQGQSYFMIKLAVGWIVILVAIVFVARKFWKDAPVSQPTEVVSGSTKEVNSAEDQFLLSEASPLCGEVLSTFLNARTPEERNQFVSSPITTAARMANFYLTNPLETIDPRGMILQNAAIAHLPAGSAVELQLGSREGQLLDVAFLKENDEWRIDWNHFVRYSETPWQLFLAGSGEAEGEFRLLARERLAKERKNADTISIVLYAPRFGYTHDTGLQSPEFLVRRDTPEGELLDAAFKLERSGKRPFSVNLPSIDPEELIRVRVKVRRTTANLERQFEIAKVIACHWYSTDEPGVEITGEVSDRDGKMTGLLTPEAPASSLQAAPSSETNAETPTRLAE